MRKFYGDDSLEITNIYPGSVEVQICLKKESVRRVEAWRWVNGWTEEEFLWDMSKKLGVKILGVTTTRGTSGAIKPLDLKKESANLDDDDNVFAQLDAQR